MVIHKPSRGPANACVSWKVSSNSWNKFTGCWRAPSLYKSLSQQGNTKKHMCFQQGSLIDKVKVRQMAGALSGCGKCFSINAGSANHSTTHETRMRHHNPRPSPAGTSWLRHHISLKECTQAVTQTGFPLTQQVSSSSENVMNFSDHATWKRMGWWSERIQAGEVGFNVKKWIVLDRQDLETLLHHQ